MQSRATAHTVSGPGFVLSCALAMNALNLPLLEYVGRNLAVQSAREAFFLLTVPIAVVAFTTLVLSPLLLGPVRRGIAATLFVVNAIVASFTTAYGAVMSADLMRSVFESNLGEAGELVEARLLCGLVLLAGLPILWLRRVQVVEPADARSRWRSRAAAPLGALATLAVIGALFHEDYGRLGTSHPHALTMVMPSNYLTGFVEYGHEVASELAAPFHEVGPDAVDADRAAGPPSLVVLAVGETARAANHGLYGYGRQTTPELARRGAIALQGATACGTYTAVSLPCMFSDLTARHFDGKRARARGNLLDVAVTAGTHVVWRDNDGGCKGVCDRIEADPTYEARVPGLCRGVQCLDEILLRGLAPILAAARSRESDTLVVLHLMGSHGPTYFERYPPEFARFLPACTTNRIQRCNRQSLVNAYDNSILYTDSILGRLIDLLTAERHGVAASLLYLSDHGESLGEEGRYLHGAPREHAPREQLEIPFVYWLSPEAQAKAGLDADCLRERAQRGPYSHDNLFHSTLGLLGIETSARDPGLDVFEPCKGRAARTSAPRPERGIGLR